MAPGTNIQSKENRHSTVHHLNNPKLFIQQSPTRELMYIDFYASRKEGGRGLRQIEASGHNAIVGLGKYVISHQDDL